MEEIDQGGYNQNDFNEPNPDPDGDTVSISKKKIYLAVGVALIVIMIVAILFVAWDVYKRNIRGNESAESGQEVANQETPSTDDPGGDSTEESDDTEAFDLFSEKYIVVQGSQTSSDQNSGGSSSGGNSGTAEKPAEVKKKWKTYINADIGYMLQYPEGWKVIEIEEYNETIQKNVKYIKIESPKSKYALFWGIKENADPFEISDRTGVGMGELVHNGKVMILETEVETKKFVHEGKILEYLAEGISGSFKTKDGKHSCMAVFHPVSDEYIGKSSSPNIPEVEKVKEILETVQLIPRSGKICQSQLSEQEKSILDGWGAFYNKKYKYLVRISNGWTKASAPVDEITDPNKIVTYVNEKDPYERFQIRSEEHALVEIPKTWTKFAAKKIKVACAETNVEYFSRSDMVFLVTYLSHNGRRHSIYYGFKSPGASMTSSVIETYEALIKSIVFDE